MQRSWDINIKKKTFVVIKINDKPQFAFIDKICLVGDIVKFKIQKMFTGEFNKHFGAFQVFVLDRNYDFLEYKDLPKFVPCLYVKSLNLVATRFWL